MRSGFCVFIALGLFLSSATVRADVWDLDPFNEDDGSGTDNEVMHGTVQQHDMLAQGGVADQDWYLVQTHGYSSYEAVIEGLTGELVFGMTLDRVNAAGTTLTAGGVVPGGYSNQSVRWQNITATPQTDFVRVAGGGQCAAACDTNDQYTFRFYETTTSIARYNNSGTQTTVLLLQNPTDYAISGRVFFWSAAGAYVTEFGFTLNPKVLATVATASFTGATSGSITITNTGRYGDLQGKAVALEPATGFSFDTPMVYRPH
jgi:hypothetical protein